MPGKTEQVLFCKLSAVQRSMYETYLQSDEVKKIIQGSNRSAWFGPIVKLRKICNHPDLVCGTGPGAIESFLRNESVLGDDVDTDSQCSEIDTLDRGFAEDLLIERSGKLEVLAKILPLWHKQGHRVLLFSQWKKTLNIIQQFTVSQVNIKGEQLSIYTTYI